MTILANISLALRSPAVHHIRAFSSGGERFPDTEEVTSSNLVTPTKLSQAVHFDGLLSFVSRRDEGLRALASSPVALAHRRKPDFCTSSSRLRIVRIHICAARYVARIKTTRKESQSLVQKSGFRRRSLFARALVDAPQDAPTCGLVGRAPPAVARALGRLPQGKVHAGRQTRLHPLEA